MEEILSVFITIFLTFFIFLWARNYFENKKICSICFAVSLTWIIFLALHFLEIFQNKIILAVLLGQSSLGIFYLAEAKAGKNAKIFRLPFLMTLTFIVYALINGIKELSSVLVFIILIWVLFLVIYIFRNSSNVRKFFNKITECCRE